MKLSKESNSMLVNRNMYWLVAVLAILMTACSNPRALAPTVESTPGSHVAANINSPALDATAQNDQYQRDAQATGTARAIQFEQDMQHIQGTAQAATQAAQYAQATFAAQATQSAIDHSAQATQNALAAQMTAQAIQVDATTTAAAQAIAQAEAEMQATATAQMLAGNLAATATSQAITLREAETAAQRNQIVTTASWGLILLAASILMPLGLWLAMVAIRAYRSRAGLIKHGPFDAPLLVWETGNGRRVVLDPQRLFNPGIIIDQDGEINSPVLVPPVLQANTTAAAQAVAVQQASHTPHAPTPASEQHTRRQIGGLQWEHTRRTGGRMPDIRVHGNGNGHQLPDARQPARPSGAQLPRMAPWRILDDWRGGSLPLGLSTGGLLLADPETAPHFLMAGTSGSGKTRYGLRPLIAAALADGWQVSIFDRSGVDFAPFAHHPNAALVLLRRPGEAVGHLEHLYAEIQQRFALLRQTNASTWGRLPGGQRTPPRQLVVFDEFSALADSLGRGEREALWRGARMVAAEGRKAGVHLALAVQDPTHKSLDLRIRRNCTPVAFRVKDSDASRVILGASGAEQLPPRQFITALSANGLTTGVAFAPDDEALYRFMHARPVRALPAPKWLNGSAPQRNGHAPANGAHAPGNGTHSTATRQPQEYEIDEAMLAEIRTRHARGASLNAIQRALFGYTGGWAYQVVSGALYEEVE